jgi:hypothetical protein
VLACSHQPNHLRSRFIPRRLGKLRKAQPRPTKPDWRSWNFDEDERDFGEKENPPKPHASPWDFASFGG